MFTPEPTVLELIREHTPSKPQLSDIYIYNKFQRFIIGKLPSCKSMHVDNMLNACSPKEESKCINPVTGQLN